MPKWKMDNELHEGAVEVCKDHIKVTQSDGLKYLFYMGNRVKYKGISLYIKTLQQPQKIAQIKYLLPW